MALLLGMTFVAALFLGAALRLLNPAPNAMIELELAGTPDRADALFRQWGKGADVRLAVAVGLDCLLVVVYAVLLVGASAWTSLATSSQSLRAVFAVLAISQLAGAIADGVENYHLIRYLIGDRGASHLRSARKAAKVKFSLLLGGIAWALPSLRRAERLGRAGAALPGQSPSTNQQNLHSDLLEDTLAAYEAEHKELTDHWRSIDTKAQGTVALAGLFTSGLFVFLREPIGNGAPVERLLLAAVLLLLILAVAGALYTLSARRFASRPGGSQVRELADDATRLCLHSGEALVPEVIGRYRHTKLTLFERQVARLKPAVAVKGQTLAWAQGLLFMALLAAFAFTALRLAGPARPAQISSTASIR